MKYNFKDFSLYSEMIRKDAKENLICDINGNLDRKLILFRNHFVDEFTNRNVYLQQLNYIVKVKELSRKVIEDEFLLNIYLDNEVRKSIISILSIIEKSGLSDETIKELEKIGFNDTKEYLGEVVSLEEIHRDLFEKAGLDFVPYENLALEIEMKQYSLSKDELLNLKVMCEKEGIDYKKRKYNCRDITPCEIATMSLERLNLLATKNKISMK